MRELLEDIGNIIQELSNEGCFWSGQGTDEIEECITNYSKNTIDYNDMCLSCKAKELLERNAK